MDLLLHGLPTLSQGLHRSRCASPMAQLHSTIWRMDSNVLLHANVSYQRLHGILPRKLVGQWILHCLCRHSDLLGALLYPQSRLQIR